jgi:hypothetical protein
MKPGNLVKVTRATFGVPKGSIGLIIESHMPLRDSGLWAGEKELIHRLQLIGTKTALKQGYHARRYLARYLEVIN